MCVLKYSHGIKNRVGKRIQIVSETSQQYLHNFLTVMAFKYIDNCMEQILVKNLDVFCYVRAGEENL